MSSSDSSIRIHKLLDYPTLLYELEKEICLLVCEKTFREETERRRRLCGVGIIPDKILSFSLNPFSQFTNLRRSQKFIIITHIEPNP